MDAQKLDYLFILQRNNVMKKTLKYTTLAALAALAADAIPAYAETLSVEYNPTTSSEMKDLTDASIYTPEVTEIKSTDDLNLTYSANDKYSVFNMSKDLTVNDITVNATANSGAWAHYFLRVLDNTSLNINSLTYKMSSNWGGYCNAATKIYLAGKTSFNIKNDLIYELQNDQNEINFNFESHATSTVNIGGNLELIAPNAANLNIQLGGSENFTVGGILKMNGEGGMKRIQLDNASTGSTEKTYNRSFGGLSVNNGGQLRIAGTANNTVNLTFTNSTEESYAGYLMTKADSTGNKFNISMNATTAAGKQTLRFLDATGKTFDKVTYNNAAIDTVSVSNGTLSLGMNSAMSANKLVVNGEKAVFDITSADGASEIGKATFGSFEGLKGAIAFDFAKDSNDFIDITGTANASSDLAFIVNMTKADFDSFLGEGETSLQYNIISFTTEGSSFDATTVICSDSSLKGKIDLIKGAGTTSVMLTITAVPEPATVAAILGAVALAFAAYRRRK